MPGYPVLRLRKGKEGVVSRRHPWIFSGALQDTDIILEDGDTVEVSDSKGNYICTGHYQDASIKVRILSFEQVSIDAGFWKQRVQQAYALRKWIGLDTAQTNAFRLINAEGDGLPGLIVDKYGPVMVIQAHSIGMHRAIGEIGEALRGMAEAVYDKSNAALPATYASGINDGFLYGELDPLVRIMENGLSFEVNVAEGQKTGFFLDQRDNRALLQQYSSGRSVINAFSYTGGFSVYALRGGSTSVSSVDISAKAVEAAVQNAAINGYEAQHTAVVSDVMAYLRECSPADIVVLDPPAFAKSLEKRHNAVQGYKRLNLEGIRKVAPGGLLFTFSCSQVVDKQLFYHTVTAAAIESGRDIRVLSHLGQPADHPVSIFHPEGHYLKGLVLQIL